MTDQQLQNSYRLCHDIMKDRAKNFFHAFKNLPSDRFKYIQSVYAFCRYVDDTADIVGVKSPKKAQYLLQEIKDEVDRYYQNPEKYVINEEISQRCGWLVAFIDTLNQVDIKQKYLNDQIEGQLQDLNFKQPKTEDDLIEYSKKVAGSVGLMLMPMLIADHKETNDIDIISICEQLGIAMQITNILRDIGEDIRNRNRVYLPKDLLSKFSVDLEYIRNISLHNQQEDNPAHFDSFISIWEYLAQKSETMYQLFIDNILVFHESCQLSLIVAALNYQGILENVRTNNYNCLTQRCYTSKSQQALSIISAKKIINNLRMAT